ncbi:MAG: hypothetical protein JWM19_5181 [Actinomycetia bacterium]|nr:hypothetical protein [Actinomycetes bacterium]
MRMVPPVVPYGAAAPRHRRDVRDRPRPVPARPVLARIGQGLLATLAVVATLAVLAPLAEATPVEISGGPGPVGINGQFGLAVAAGNQGRASYFQLNVPPGRLAAAAAVIANLGDKTETLAIGHAAGITAANGGSAYRLASRGCAGPGCWVTGLPRLVTLPAHGRELLEFTVRVPATTTPGQYLTGISAQPTTASGAMKVGSNRNSPSKAVVVEVVTIGVAVTVGDLSAMTTRLRIAAVQGTTIGHLARINIRLDNTGQTFSRAAGAASCEVGGRQRTSSVRAGTVLPHDNALIIVNTPGLPLGATVPRNGPPAPSSTPWGLLVTFVRQLHRVPDILLCRV